MATEQITKLRSETAYAPLVHDLRDAIASGRLGLGDRISGEVALSKDYGISVTSVRSGIEALVNDGLLRRKRGSGTYVTGGKVTAPAAAARSVRCDTIAVGSIVNAVTYHPYYTERLAGFRAGLVQHGWTIWEHEQDGVKWDESWDYTPVPYNWDLPELWRDLGSRQELAGIMMSAALIPTDEGWRPSAPTISPDYGARVPFVAYDWELEIETCLRHLLSRGCKRIWTTGVFAPDLLNRAAGRAAGALGLAAPELLIRQTSPSVRSFSASVRVAYDLARQDLITGNADVDGIFAPGDFEAQGILDAMHEGRGPSALPFIAMINKESRLHLLRQITRLVLDGYRHGEILADTLAKLILRPNSAPSKVILNGQLEIYD